VSCRRKDYTLVQQYVDQVARRVNASLQNLESLRIQITLSMSRL